jgi:lactate dehydrogenase-like 2-hydroxyacid dehydrogenase
MLPFVLITHNLPKDWLALLDGQVQALIGPQDSSGFSADLLERLPEAEGLFTLVVDRVDENILSRAACLRVVSNMAVGVDNVDVAACTRRGLPVGNTPGVLTEATADLAMALLLSAARRLPEASQDARQGRWSTWSPTGWLGFDLNGALLGIIGLGKIGQAVARRARGFGLRLVYTDTILRPKLEIELGARYLPLDDLLRQSDFVSVHVPLLPSTRHLIDERALRLMKPSAVLVNAARGPIVDTVALSEALKEGWIAAAALDVTDPEPLPASHPLFGLPNCLVVPHIGSATRGTRRAMAESACRNLLAGLAGVTLPYCVNPEVYGY